MNQSRHLKLAKYFWTCQLKEGDIAIDATCGNGHDTLFLSKMGLSALFALDIQSQALEKTRLRLKENLNPEELEKVIFCQMSHEDLTKVPCQRPPRLIVYNLGYLPGGDKTLTTRTETTLASITSALSILSKDGAISIICYPGHDEGSKEREALLRFAASLSSPPWEVWHHMRFAKPHSPSLIWIARLDHS